MIKLENYIDYNCKILDHLYFKSNTDSGVFTSKFYYGTKEKLYLAKIINSENLKNKYISQYYMNDLNIYDLPEVKKYKYEPQDGDSFLFCNKCKIPRNSLTKLKKVRKKTEDSVFVIPENIRIGKLYDVLIFKNDDIKEIYLLLYSKNLSQYVKKDNTIEQFYNNLVNQNKDLKKDFKTRADISNAKYVEQTDLYLVDEEYFYFYDIINGLYQKIIFEKDLLKVNRSENQFNVDIVKNIQSLLDGNDEESILQGMRILAEFDYINNKSIVKYILGTTYYKWYNYKNKFNTSVKFMINSLGNIYEILKNVNIMNVTKEEYEKTPEIFNEFIKDIIELNLQNAKSKTNLKIDIDYNLNISYK